MTDLQRTIKFDRSDDSLMIEAFWENALRKGHIHLYGERWLSGFEHMPTPDEFKEAGWHIVASKSSLMLRNYILTSEKATVNLHVQGGRVYMNLVADTLETAKTLSRNFHKIFPTRKVEDDRIPTDFWYLGKEGPESLERQLVAPDWKDIRLNYTAKARDALDTVIGWTGQPGAAGQLMLWHGEPGCGKTYAIRAMVKAWKPWATCAYITDPERFFMEASYMMEVLLEDNAEFEAPADDKDFTENVSTEEFEEYPDSVRKFTAMNEGAKPKLRWKLVVLEDCGELMTKDAKTRVGQALSRLLNVADGFIGQGLRVLILITTNEEVGVLHEAVSRPGRCASRIEFGPLRPDEIEAWQKEHNGSADKGTRSRTLADLYAGLRGEQTGATAERRVGFAPVG